MNDENEPKTGEVTQRSSNSDHSSSRSSSSSSAQAPEVPLTSVKEEEGPRIPEQGQPEAEEPKRPEQGPPEPTQGPGEVRFTEPDETSSRRQSSSSSSSSDNSEAEEAEVRGQGPPEPGSLTLTRDPTVPSERAVSAGNLVPNLLRDSQEMNADKFQAVRDRIAAVLRLTKHQSYELR